MIYKSITHTSHDMEEFDLPRFQFDELQLDEFDLLGEREALPIRRLMALNSSMEREALARRQIDNIYCLSMIDRKRSPEDSTELDFRVDFDLGRKMAPKVPLELDFDLGRDMAPKVSFADSVDGFLENFLFVMSTLVNLVWMKMKLSMIVLVWSMARWMRTKDSSETESKDFSQGTESKDVSSPLIVRTKDSSETESKDFSQGTESRDVSSPLIVGTTVGIGVLTPCLLPGQLLKNELTDHGFICSLMFAFSCGYSAMLLRKSRPKPARVLKNAAAMWMSSAFALFLCIVVRNLFQ